MIKKETVTNQSNEELKPFTEDFIFSMVMRDPDICRGFLKLILPNEDIGEVRVETSDNDPLDENAEIEVITQASMKFVEKMHGVRFENGVVPICVSRLMGTPSATGSPALAGYEPTALCRRVPTLRSNSLCSLLSVLPSQA